MANERMTRVAIFASVFRTGPVIPRIRQTGAKPAHPRSIWAKQLMYCIATVIHSLMRRDARKVAEWYIKRIIPCHGDVIDEGANDAWSSTYEWFLKGKPEPGLLMCAKVPFMTMMRWILLL